MASVRPFHRYRGEASFTMAQFILVLSEQLPQVAPSQSRYRVTEKPTARTIRFYTARKLVDKPLAKDGVHALYGYRHLLQVLAVKYLQSQYLPLVKIRSLVENASNRDLELLIPEIAPVSAAHRGIARDDRMTVDNITRGPVDNQALPHGPATHRPVDNSRYDAASADLWHRIEVGPGIELHVHEAALTAGNRERLRGSLLRELGVLRGWFGDEKK